MAVVTEFPFAVTDEPDVGIVLSDGCRLSARIWRAVGAGPVPAVLEYIPYRKRDGTLPRDEMMHPYVAGHGYACIRVDMRGNGDSDGLMEDEYNAQELADACEVIAWLSAQPWCSGAVGMMGKSWGGFNCLQTAFLQPPALKAGRSARRVETDLLTGAVTLVVEEDGGDIENSGHGLVSGETVTERWAIHPDDPLSARATHVWEQRLSRGDWAVRTIAWAEMAGTATAWQGDVPVFDREWQESVPRRFV